MTNSIEGPMGPQGNKGDQGPVGPKGDKGDAGCEGRPGKDLVFTPKFLEVLNHGLDLLCMIANHQIEEIHFGKKNEAASKEYANELEGKISDLDKSLMEWNEERGD